MLPHTIHIRDLTPSAPPAMALTDRKSSVQIRPANKEPEWSSICNNVFDQYLDGDDLFGFGTEQRERSSSDDSRNLFDFSGSSEQSHRTDTTSPILSWTSESKSSTEARQPKAKAPVDFWHKKLRALEQNAADCERRQQKLRTTKSHPDFLSLGGFPSPPAIPGSPTIQSLSVQRQRSRQLGPAANGRKPTTQRSVTNLRAVSRGRPAGVTKPPATAASVNPSATIRKYSASPSKMMTPSRYRAGFKDVWAERIQGSPKKFELRLPTDTDTFPASPPPSARSTQDTFAAFGSPTYRPVPGCDEQISPLASTFQQAARIHTPLASPLLSPGSHAIPSYFQAPLSLPNNPYATVPLNDVAPLYPDRGSSLATNKIQEFDFGFSNSSDLNDTWSTAPFVEPPSTSYSATDTFSNDDPFGDFSNSLLINQQSQNHNQNLGLGISCDPSVIGGNYTTAAPDTALLPNSSYQAPLSASPFYVPSLPNGLPYTPRRQRGSPTRSPSPPATESRSRRASGSRRNSRHRRTKSASTTPRHHQGADKAGFVNFTPQDHGKILNGVAPSGSSKTKARREKEAADKRRRLSQAAVKAVIEAGGDVETLQKAGIIV